MKIGVTAASGKLGCAIVKALIEQDPKNKIIALARTPERAVGLGVEVRAGDYNNPLQLEQSLVGIDSLLLISGIDAPEKRIGQHRNVINAAKKAGVKKLVYTSIQGAEENTAFSPVIQSNRQTEKDIQSAGFEWVIGRNGIYIEPDVEYIENYKKRGGIYNCAGEGRCGYTTRAELAYAYARMLVQDKHKGEVYNLHGQAITQTELANYMNLAFGTSLTFKSMTVEAFKQDRIEALGVFFGTIVAGIYQGIREGKSNNPSQYLQAAGREHISWQDYFSQLKSQQ